ETLEIILRELSQESIPIETDAALNERNYGIYTGKNKWDIKKEIGESKFLQIRRGWNESIPQGESLKQVYERVIPYYKSAILPKLLEGKNCIISSSGNALRALIKYLEQVSDEEIATIELGTGEVRDYIIGKNGSVISKKILLKNEKIP
ncbi:MAG: histidine phosphatase family protein, partial [Candidatus Levybacteria bacterium]|nr:histidine phosphatase family protein [Candidatus Levybacteria bacterium]